MINPSKALNEYQQSIKDAKTIVVSPEVQIEFKQSFAQIGRELQEDFDQKIKELTDTHTKNVIQEAYGTGEISEVTDPVPTDFKLNRSWIGQWPFISDVRLWAEFVRQLRKDLTAKSGDGLVYSVKPTQNHSKQNGVVVDVEVTVSELIKQSR